MKGVGRIYQQTFVDTYSQHHLHRPAAQERDQNQHGWERRLARQRLRRAPVADHQIRGAYASVPKARASIGRYIDGFYNARRPYSNLDWGTRDEAYFAALQSIPVAA
jgi:hypothetical protein